MSAVRSGTPATGVPAGASSTDRCSFSPWTSSWMSPKWGTTASPLEQAEADGQPPAPGIDHGVGEGHGRARGPDHDGAVLHAATSASHTLEPFSTLRRCMGELPAR